jgi:NADH:ubiquinone oxidoreductase subunit
MISRLFTWWDGATAGTSLLTWLSGEEIGRDERGNVYYRHKKNFARRWVIYPADNDGSRVPPDWSLWLRGTIEEVPSKALPPKRSFEKPAEPNNTGTMAAFRPDGSLGSKGIRPASTGDYLPWTPD